MAMVAGEDNVNQDSPLTRPGPSSPLAFVRGSALGPPLFQLISFIFDCDQRRNRVELEDRSANVRFARIRRCLRSLVGILTLLVRFTSSSHMRSFLSNSMIIFLFSFLISCCSYDASLIIPN